ncbi:MAG: hypothetical protein M3Q69_07510 [Acidobacteriota bacterium]|nr:hypothetical protein [Acidobacteriota bacterium]
MRVIAPVTTQVTVPVLAEVGPNPPAATDATSTTGTAGTTDTTGTTATAAPEKTDT